MTKHYIARFSTREDYDKCKKPRYEHVYYESGPLKNQLIYEGLKPKKELVVPSKTPIMGICGLSVGSVDPNKIVYWKQIFYAVSGWWKRTYCTI